jgi:hypothetical protein
VFAKNTIDEFLTALRNEPWALAVAIASIALAAGFYCTARAWFTHREKMAQLEKGTDGHPIASKEEQYPNKPRRIENA